MSRKHYFPICRCGKPCGDFYSKRCYRCYHDDRIGKERWPLRDRFMKYVRKTETCWLWTGCRSSQGYGQIKISGKMEKATRIAFKLFKNIEPGNYFVCHACDNPPCVNPEHLWLGTRSDNAIDAVKKGRIIILKGIHHPASKLSPEKANKIRALYASGEYTLERIGSLFNVSGVLIGNVVRNEAWISRTR